MPRRIRTRSYRSTRFEALESRALLAADSATGLSFTGPRRGGRNPIDPYDVNGDSTVTNLDVQVLVSKVRATGSGFVLDNTPASADDNTPCYDVTDDGVVTNLDVAKLVSALRSADKLNAGTLVYLEAELSGAEGLTATVEYRVGRHHGVVDRHFEASVSGATPGSDLVVTVAGVEVGTLHVGDDGTGALEFSNRPQLDADELAFPDNFPDVVAGDTVDIGGLASGTLDVADTSADPELPPPPHEGGAVIHTVLRSDGLEYAQVKLQVKNTTDGVEVELAVRLERAAAGTYDVKLNDIVVGSITVDDSGRGQIVFSTNPTGTEVAFPTDLALEGTLTIAVGDTLSGEITFPLPPTAHDGVLLSADLSGLSGATGTATLSVSPDSEHLLPNLKFTLTIDNGPAGAELPIVIGATTVGTITLDDAGHGEVVFSTHPAEGELLLGLDFPMIKPGSTITVGDDTSGVFAIPEGAMHPLPPPPPHR